MARRAPRKAKVALYGTPNKAALVEEGATVGAVVGENLYFADGRLVTVEDLAGGGSSTPSPVLSYTLWRLIGEIPANVLSVASLATQGLVTRIAGDNWTTRSVAVASTARLTVSNGDGVSGNPTLDMADVDALSVWGRASGTSGKPAPIVASANDRLLTRVAGAIAFTQLTSGMFPAAVVPDAALSSNVPLKDAPNTFTVSQAIENSQPILWFVESGAATDNRRWAVNVVGGTLYLQAWNDAISSGESFLSVTRSDEEITNVSLFGDAITHAAAYTSFNGTGFIRGDVPNTLTLQMGTSGMEVRNSAANAIRFSMTDAGAATFGGPINIPSSSYFVGNASAGFRFNNEADTLNLLTITDGGTVIVHQDDIRSNFYYGRSSTSYYLRPNHDSAVSYGGWFVTGATGGYHGVVVNDGGVYPTFMSDGSNAGIYNQGDGRWMLYRNTSSRVVSQYQEFRHVSDSAFISFYDDGQTERTGYVQGHAASGIYVHSEISGNDLFLVTDGGTVLVSNNNGGTYAELVTQESGSFTGSLSGMSSATSGTFYWSRTGSKVTMYTRSAITGTTNAATMQLSGIPASIRPAHAKLVRCGFLYSGTAASTGANIGAVLVNTDGTADFFLVQTTAAGIVDSNFAITPSTKGVANNWSITYDLD